MFFPWFPWFPWPPRPPVPPTVCPPGTFTYTVRAGDTFFSIAQRYGTTVAALRAANPGVDPNRLFPGQRICVPIVTPPIPPTPPGICPPGTITYIVQPGDTLTSIAVRYGTTVAAILAVNPGITDPNFIPVGFRLCIPRVAPPTVCPPGTFTYTVVAGDTFFGLANRFGTTVAAIQAANPGVDPTMLFVGQRICIPLTTPPGPPIPGVCPPGTFAYTVVAGDTLFAIAQRFGTTVAAIVAANPGLDPNLIFPGQRICIPRF